MTRAPVLDPQLDVIGALAIGAYLNFILWTFGRGRDGRLTKLPRTVDGQPCAWRDPRHRAAFARVAAAYRVRVRPGSHLWGVGYVFADDHHVALDLDRCRDAATGQLTDTARALLAACPTYAEISPSGEGLHLVAACRGPKPPNFKNRAAGVELIATTFLTLTGHAVTPTARPITDCTDVLADLVRRYGPPQTAAHASRHEVAPPDDVDVVTGAEGIGPDDLPRPVAAIPDAELIARASGAANGAKFATLWAGDARAYASASEADLALCALLAFWTQGDATRIDRLFRQSGLCREKWTRDDYRARTIARAIAGATTVYEPPVADHPTAAPLRGLADVWEL